MNADGPVPTVEDVLRSVARTACETLGIARCSAYLGEPGDERLRGVVGHPGPEIDAAVRRLTVGGENDAFTREIVKTRMPVLIRDVASDPRAAQGTLRNWHVRAVLGVPMLIGEDLIGVLFLDNVDRPYPYTSDQVAAATDLAALAAGAVANTREAERTRTRLATVVRQNRLLRHAATVDHRLHRVVLGGGGVRAIVQELAEVTGEPTCLYDATGRRVAEACASDDCEGTPVTLLEEIGESGIATLVQDAEPGSAGTVGPMLERGVRRRHLLAPVDLGERRWGLLAMLERRARLTAFDEMAARRGACHIALELLAQRRAVEATWNARSSLTRQLIRGTQDVEDLRRSADYLGITLDAQRVVVFVTRRAAEGAGSPHAESLLEAVRRRLDGEVLATAGTEGVALLVSIDGESPALRAIDDVKRAVAEACAEIGGAPEAIAGISTRCPDPGSLPRGYREAREVVRCIDGFGGSDRVLAADDLGPGRLFVANGSVADIERFVDDVAGPLLTGEPGVVDLLQTLQCFFDTGRSVRASAARLGVHENTIRYRLARVGSLTGLDVAGDAGDQLSAQMALLVLRLQGHSALQSPAAAGPTLAAVSAKASA